MQLMTEALARVRIQEVRGLPHLQWSEGGEFMLPDSLLPLLAGPGGDPGALVISELPAAPALSEAALVLCMREAFTPTPPTSSRLPVSYQRVPQVLRNLVGRVIGARARRRMDQWAHFPRWPLDLSADLLADLAAPRALRQGPAPVLVSHDLDTAEGLSNFLRWFAPMEEAMGAHSANYVVPCAWPLDHGQLGELRQRGHELGIHGYDHSNRTPYCADNERHHRIAAAGELMQRYAISGYRAPSLVRTGALLDALAPVYRYDSSIPTSGGLFPVPNNGCASARPFQLNGIAELPVSMPRDGSLRFLGFRPSEILEIWKDCAIKIALSGGIVSLLTHCESRFSGHPEMRPVYRSFLEFISEDSRFAFSTTDAVLESLSGPRPHA